MGRRVLLLRFGIYRQHPELVRLISNKINNAQPSLLTCAFAPPAKFAYTAGAPDDRAGFRVLHHELLQFAVFVVVQIVRSHAVEGSRLDKHEHKSYPTPLAYLSQTLHDAMAQHAVEQQVLQSHPAFPPVKTNASSCTRTLLFLVS